MSAYLATLPQVTAAWGTRVAFLTSLRQVSVLDTADPGWGCSFHTQEEPALLALSEHLAAMSCGNQVGGLIMFPSVFQVAMCACDHAPFVRHISPSENHRPLDSKLSIV